MGNDKRNPENKDNASERIVEELNELIEEAEELPLDEPRDLPHGGPGPGH